MTSPKPQPHTAVMLMAYGTPRHRDEIESYYTDIRRGRPPTPEALADLVARYEAIGGLSPLAELTERQQQRLQQELDAIDPGGYRVELGLKHADPKIEASVEQLASEGVTKITGLVLALTIRRIPSGNTSTERELQLSRTASLFLVSTAGRQSPHLLSSSPAILRLVSNRCQQTAMLSSPLTHCLNELLIQVTPIQTSFAPLHRQLLAESASRRATVGQSVGKAPDEPLSRGSVLTFSM